MGLQRKQSITEVCRQHQISQSQYYKWHNRFLEGGKNALVYGAPSKKEAMFEVKIKRLQKIIGNQTVQIEILKNRGNIWDKAKEVKELVKAGFTIKDACFGLGISWSRDYEVISKKSR